MTGFVVDASVVVKWLIAEKFSDQSASLLDRDLNLIAPELVFAEAANALWTLWKRGDIGKDDQAEAIDLLKAAPIGVPYTMRQLAASAGRLAVDLNHPVYNCFYLALALQEQYPVITADRKFFDTVQAHPYLRDQIEHVGNLK